MFADYKDEIEAAMVFGGLTTTPEEITEAIEELEEIRTKIEAVDVWDIGDEHEDAYEAYMNDTHDVLTIAGMQFEVGTALRKLDERAFYELTHEYYNAFDSENEAFPERGEALSLIEEYLSTLRDMAYRAADFERFTLSLPGDEIDAFPPCGDATDAVETILQYASVSAQLDAIGAAKICDELSEYGAWDDEELSDNDKNRMRIVWIAAGKIKEESE